MSTGDVKVDCSFVLSEVERTHEDFVSFCHTGLGVPPSRVLRDLSSWLDEDTGHGDQTLTSGFWGQRHATAVIVAKEDFVLAGLPVAAEVFRQTSGGLVRVFADLTDGSRVKKGDVVLTVQGPAAALLMAERTALNFLCRVSGVATRTRGVVESLERAGSTGKPVLLETRKTTPGHRLYEKYATRLGGAQNHRHGLDSGAMLKENHLRAIGNIRDALKLLKSKVPVLSKIEIEVTSLEEFRVALEEGADLIMLDNFSWDDVAVAVKERNMKSSLAKLEVSGNLDGDKARQLVISGVDFVSMGSLIHKSVWVDMSLQLFV